MIRARSMLGAAYAALLFAASPVGADELVAHGGGEVRETMHRIDLSCGNGVARAGVERRFEAVGRAAAAGLVRIDVPRRAVASRFSVVKGKPGELASLQEGTLGLYLPALNASEERVVRYTLEWPIEAGDEAAPTVLLDMGGASAAKGAAVSSGGLARPQIRYEGKTLAWNEGHLRGSDLALQLPCGEALPAGAHGAIAQLPSGETLIGIDVVLPRPVIEIAKRPRVVVAVDASHSVGTEGLSAQFDLVRGIARATPQARLAVVLYDRKARWFSQGFVEAGTLAPSLAGAESGRVALGHGSQPEAAVSAAAELLRDTPGDARVIVLTDGQWSAGYEAAWLEQAAALLPSLAVLQLVHVQPGPAVALEPMEHAHSAIARAHGGGVWRATLPWSGSDREAVADAVRHLVLPDRVEDPVLIEEGGERLAGPGGAIPPLRGAHSASFAVIRPAPADAAGQQATGELRLEGRVWAVPWSMPVALQPRLFRRAALRALANPESGLSVAQRDALAESWEALVLGRALFVSGDRVIRQAPTGPYPGAWRAARVAAASAPAPTDARRRPQTHSVPPARRQTRQGRAGFARRCSRAARGQRRS